MTWYNIFKTSALIQHRVENVPKTTADIDNLKLAERFYVFLQRYEAAPFISEHVNNKKDEDTDYDRKKLTVLYHGTSSATFGKITEYGELRSPETANAHQIEFRPATKKQIFFSPNRETSYSGATSGKQLDGIRIRLHAKVPLYAIAEIKTAIFKPKVKHPYHYNESFSYTHGAFKGIIEECFSKINNAISQAKNSKEKKQIERTNFIEAIKQLKKYINSKSSVNEYTIDTAFPLRFIYHINFPDPIAGHSSYQSLNTALEKDDEATKKKIFKELETKPTIYNLISKKTKDHKLYQEAAKKTWFNKISKDSIHLRWLPMEFLDPELNNKEEFELNGKKFSLNSYILKEIKPNFINSILKADAETLADILHKAPLLFKMDKEIGSILKNIFLKLGEKNPNVITGCCGLMPKGFWSENSFITELAEKVLAKASTSRILDLYSAKEGIVDAQQAPLSSNILYHPAVLKVILNKIDVMSLDFLAFPEKVLTENKELFKQSISNKFNNDTLSSSQIESIQKIPTFLIPENINELFQKNVLKDIESNIHVFYSNYTKYPKKITQSQLTKDAILNKAKDPKYVNSDYLWTLIDNYYIDLLNDPQIKESFSNFQLLKKPLSTIKYNDLNDKQKIVYKQKLIDTLKTSYTQIQFAPLELKNDKEVIESLCEGIATYSSAYDYNLGSIIKKLTEYGIDPKIIDPFKDELYYEYILNNPNGSTLAQMDITDFINNPEIFILYKEKLGDSMLTNNGMYTSFLSYIIKTEKQNNIEGKITSDPSFLNKYLSGFTIAALLNGYGTLEQIISQSVLAKNNSQVIYKNLLTNYFEKKKSALFDSYNKYNEENKELFKTKALNSLSSSFEMYNYLSPEFIKENKDEILKKAAECYVYNAKNHYMTVPPVIIKDEDFSKYHDYINSSILESEDASYDISTGKVYGLFTEKMSPELLSKYKKIQINQVSSNPNLYSLFDQNLANDPEIIEATKIGIKKYIDDNYIEDINFKFFRSNEIFKQYIDSMSDTFYNYYKSKVIESLNDLNYINNIISSVPEEYLTDEIMQLILDRLSNNYTYNYLYGNYDKKTPIKDSLIDKNKNKWIDAFMEKIAELQGDSILDDLIHNSENYNTSNFTELTEKQKTKLINKIIKEAPGMGWLNILNLFRSLEKASMLNDNVKLALLNSFKKMFDEQDQYYKNNIRSRINNYFPDLKDFLMIVKISPEEESKNIHSKLNGYNPDIINIAEMWKNAILKNPGNPLLLSDRELIVDKFVIKINASQSISTKKKWCSIANGYFPGNPKLTICNSLYKKPPKQYKSYTPNSPSNTTTTVTPEKKAPAKEITKPVILKPGLLKPGLLKSKQ